jgi:hypothetical protein
MKKMLDDGNQIHNFISSLVPEPFNCGSGSTSQKVTVPTVPVLVHNAASRYNDDLRIVYLSGSLT